MPDPTADIPVPPGEYEIPGLGRLLVIEGAARLKAPAGPVNLASLLGSTADPTPTAGPTPAPKQSPWITALLAILAVLAGTQLPAVLPGKPDAPPAPVAPVEPAKPKPAPKPPEPARPDWLPEPEGKAPSVPAVYPTPQAPVYYP